MKCPHCGLYISLPSPFHQNIEQIVFLLERYGGNRTRTSEEIGVPIRTLRLWCAKLRERGIEVPAYDRTSNRCNSFRWTEEKDALLLSLRAEGLTMTEISRLMHCSVNSARLRLSRLQGEK